MKRIIFPPPSVPYSLHDKDASFEIRENALLLRLPDGMIKTADSREQTEGHIEFHGVDWGFCYAYRFDSIGSVGPFAGEKFYLKEFIEQNRSLRLSIADEVYGYRQAKYFGYIPAGASLQECIIEIYHEGDMLFVEE